MPTAPLHASADLADRLRDGFAAIRTELRVPERFSDEVLAAAEAARPVEIERADLLDVPFVAIDPPGATDLDQAFWAAPTGSGWTIRYAIADVAAFVRPGDPIDLEARERGVTLYSPDIRTPLHPEIISEDRASLLPGGERPALVWHIELDAEGMPTSARIERATVRVRAAISYAEAQQRIETGGEELFDALASIGRLRQAREADRGGVSLNLPSQEVVFHDGHYDLEYDETIPVEGWNAQISLLTGIVAADLMIGAGVGMLRTLPPPRRRDVRRLRRQAEVLGVPWPDHVDYPDFIRGVEPNNPRCQALLIQSARTLRGAGYQGFQGELPELHEHGAIASPYAHVTAPLRRLIDRFGNELLLSICADEAPPAWVIEALDELPSLMGRARSRESALERAMVDFTETVMLQPRVGEMFDGAVVDIDTKRDRATVQIAEPPVVTRVRPDGLELGQTVELRLDGVDTNLRTLAFTPIAP